MGFRAHLFKAKENEMAMFLRDLFIVAAATALLATASVGPARAQASAHHHEAATPHKLTLNHGRKWATDEPLRSGMARIRDVVEPQLGAAHADKLTPEQYKALADRIETEVGGIVANCKLEPQADAMLHLVITDLGDGTDAMKGKNTKLRPALGLVKVAQAVNQYGRYFEHPGFKRLRDLH